MCRYYENSLSSRDYILDRLASGVVYGAFVNGALAGFIGEHDEGSGGMLEVLPQYRRMGLGTLLETYNINMALQNGKTPFGQFFEENSVSRALQRSMGMEVASEPVFWLTK